MKDPITQFKTIIQKSNTKHYKIKEEYIVEMIKQIENIFNSLSLKPEDRFRNKLLIENNAALTPQTSDTTCVNSTNCTDNTICIDSHCPDSICPNNNCPDSPSGSDCVDASCIHQPDCTPTDACQDNVVGCVYNASECIDNEGNTCPGQNTNTSGYCWDQGTQQQGCIDIECQNSFNCMDGGGIKECLDQSCNNQPNTSSCLDWSNCIDATCQNNSFCQDEKPCTDHDTCQNERCINVSQCCHDEACANTICMGFSRVTWTDGGNQCVDSRCDP